MRRIEFICGIGRNALGGRLDNVDQRLERCRRVLSERYGAFTELDGSGWWEEIDEPVKVFVVLTLREVSVGREVAGRLAWLLDQSCVAMVSSPTDFVLVEREEGR